MSEVDNKKQALAGPVSMHTRPSQLVFLVFALLATSSVGAQLQPRSVSSLDNNPERTRPLPLEQAFPYFVSTSNAGHDTITWTVTWTPAPGHYLYRHAFAISLLQNADAPARSLSFSLPDGLKKTDQFFGDIEAYYGQVAAELTLASEPGPQASLVIEYQGCADWGFCYPPQRVLYRLNP